MADHDPKDQKSDKAGEKHDKAGDDKGKKLPNKLSLRKSSDSKSKSHKKDAWETVHPSGSVRGSAVSSNVSGPW